MNSSARTAIDLAALPIGLTRDSEEFRTSSHRFAQFAASVDDTNERHRAGSVGSPVFAHVPVMQSMVELVDRITSEFILHGEHDFVFHMPMISGQRWFSESRLVGARGTRAGLVLVIESITRTHEGTPVTTQYSSCLIRGLQAAGSVGSGAPERPQQPAPDGGRGTFTFPLALDQTRRYADAARDYSAYTIDPEAARKVGFEAPLVHGMLTLALAARAVVDGPAGGDTARLKRLGGRFASPLLLTEGQEVTARLGDGTPGFVVFELFDRNGAAVVRNGYAEIAS